MKSTSDAAVGVSAGQLTATLLADASAIKNLGRKVLKCSARLSQASLLALVASVAVPGANALAEGDAAAGAEKAHTCLGCHGVKHYINTYPTYHVPLIAGQHKDYLVAALQAYRGQLRSHPTMQANAGSLSDQDIEDIATWFSAQGGQ